MQSLFLDCGLMISSSLTDLIISRLMLRVLLSIYYHIYIYHLLSACAICVNGSCLCMANRQRGTGRHPAKTVLMADMSGTPESVHANLVKFSSFYCTSLPKDRGLDRCAQSTRARLELRTQKATTGLRSFCCKLRTYV